MILLSSFFFFCACSFSGHAFWYLNDSLKTAGLFELDEPPVISELIIPVYLLGDFKLAILEIGHKPQAILEVCCNVNIVLLIVPCA